MLILNRNHHSIKYFLVTALADGLQKRYLKMCSHTSSEVTEIQFNRIWQPAWQVVFISVNVQLQEQNQLYYTIVQCLLKRDTFFHLQVIWLILGPNLGTFFQNDCASFLKVSFTVFLCVVVNPAGSSAPHSHLLTPPFPNGMEERIRKKKW